MNRRLIKRRERHQHARVFERTLKWIARTLRMTGQGIAEARRVRRSYEELTSMNDLELEDIGITRADIPTVVAGRFRREHTSSNVLSMSRRKPPHLPGVSQSRGPRSKQMCNPVEGSSGNEIDVRSLPPGQRHTKIFELVNELGPGASFILVNDHDPKPLYYQLEAEYPKQFSWAYLERGPDAWRVEIGRLARAA